MELDPTTLDPQEAYHLLTALVVPRPIAWVSTVDGEGRPNLAPFSFFGGVTSHPPIVMLSVGRRRGRRKDTAANLLASREGVIHICHRPLAERMVATSADLGPEDSEFAHAGLTPIPASKVAAPRIAEAVVALEAAVDRHLEVGDAPVDLFLLRLLQVYVDDAYLDQGLPDAARLAAVGRLGGRRYCDTARPFELERPA